MRNDGQLIGVGKCSSRNVKGNAKGQYDKGKGKGKGMLPRIHVSMRSGFTPSPQRRPATAAIGAEHPNSSRDPPSSSSAPPPPPDSTCTTRCCECKGTITPSRAEWLLNARTPERAWNCIHCRNKEQEMARQLRRPPVDVATRLLGSLDVRDRPSSSRAPLPPAQPSSIPPVNRAYVVKPEQYNPFSKLAPSQFCTPLAAAQETPAAVPPGSPAPLFRDMEDHNPSNPPPNPTVKAEPDPSVKEEEKEDATPALPAQQAPSASTSSFLSVKEEETEQEGDDMGEFERSRVALEHDKWRKKFWSPSPTSDGGTVLEKMQGSWFALSRAVQILKASRASDKKAQKAWSTCQDLIEASMEELQARLMHAVCMCVRFSY